MQTHLARGAANLIMEGFDAYLQSFESITKNAKKHFENKDWHSIQSDSQARLALYKSKVKELMLQVRELMGAEVESSNTWFATKQMYSNLLDERKDYEIAETFYNSVCRKVFGSIGMDFDIMYGFSERQDYEITSEIPIYRTYPGKYTAGEIVRQVLRDHQFDVPYEDMERDATWITERVEQELLTKYKPDRQTRVEVLKSVFYRGKGAYIIGRAFMEGQYIPFILPLLHGDKGIFVDTVLFESNEVSIIFSFTRSYFFVEVDIPSELVRFLRTLIPNKPISDLYNSIGFNKHGKTEMYREFLHHLENSEDQFIIAPGIRGMVMCVFTLPSYDVVFKLIKDKFDPPKKMTRPQVKEKYKLVSIHDRVGRMADTHEFEFFEFDKKRISPELLTHLQEVVPSLLEITEDKVLIKHLYTERKMVPLNMYLDTANEQEAEEAVGEYGNAIKQLAAANIFPGDMLLKNFGVTRHRRVIFYDYDEICFLTDCNFRRIPEPRDEYEEYSSEAWYSVGENDIFPEEFKKFLIGHNHIRQMFYRLHGDIFDAKFWREMQQRLKNGEVLDVFPYRRRKRFRQI